MARSLPFFIRQTLVMRGTAVGDEYFSETYEMTGIRRLEVQFQVFKTTGVAPTCEILFSQDGINFEHNIALTEGVAATPIGEDDIYRYAKASLTGTDGNIVTFHVLARGLTT